MERVEEGSVECVEAKRKRECVNFANDIGECADCASERPERESVHGVLDLPGT